MLQLSTEISQTTACNTLRSLDYRIVSRIEHGKT